MNKLLLVPSPVSGAVSVPLSMRLWQAVDRPPALLLPVPIAVLFREGMAFGMRVLVLFRGAVWLPGALGRSCQLSLAWLFLNCWPHDGLRRSGFGQTFEGRADIDVAFHRCVIAATVITAVYLARAARPVSRSAAAPARAQSNGRPMEATR